MGTDRENVVPGNLCIIWKLNEQWPLKKDSVTFLRLLKLLKLKKNSTTALQLKVFNTEKGHHHCIKAFNAEKDSITFLQLLKFLKITILVNSRLWGSLIILYLWLRIIIIIIIIYLFTVDKKCFT